MSNKTGRVSAMCFLMVAAPAFFVSSSLMDSRPACVRGHDWVVAHAAELPRTSAQLAAYPVSLRRAIYSALSSNQKADIWLTQIGELRKKQLSPEQNAVISDAMTLLEEPSLYSPIPLAETRQLTIERMSCLDAQWPSFSRKMPKHSRKSAMV